MIKILSPEEQGGTAVATTTINPQAEIAIERQAFVCRDLRTELDKHLAALKEDLEAVKGKHLRGLRTISRQLAGQVSTLMSLVEASPELFRKPKTKVIHDIKLGFKAGAGELQFADEDTVIALIRKKLKAKKTTLIKTTHTVVKAAVKNLDPEELASIGCFIAGKDDTVYVGFIDGDIDKAVNNAIGSMVTAMTEEGK